MKLSDIAHHRLQNQRIAAHATYEGAGDVVARLGAAQAQDYAGAKWAIGLRLPGTATDAAIEQAIADRKIVRTWPMRGTLHFVAAPDVRWMLRLLTPRVLAAGARRQTSLGLDEAVFARSREVLVEALQGGEQRTRQEVMDALERAGISTAGQRGYHLVWRAAQEGLICFGPMRGKQQTFVLLDEWVPASRDQTRDESLAEIAERYFTGHGPATLHDFMWWTGLAAADARAAVAVAGPRLAHETVDGRTYWMPAEAPPRPENSGAAADAEYAAYALPPFDEYLLGYRDRSAVLDAAHAAQVCPGGNGVFAPMIVIDGRIVGTWKRAFRKGAVVFEATPFAPFSATDEQRFVLAAQRYAAFHGLPAVFP